MLEHVFRSVGDHLNLEKTRNSCGSLGGIGRARVLSGTSESDKQTEQLGTGHVMR